MITQYEMYLHFIFGLQKYRGIKKLKAQFGVSKHRTLVAWYRNITFCGLKAKLATNL